jgi:hypothetical protein
MCLSMAQALAVGSAVAGHTPICFASPSPAAQQLPGAFW